MINTTQLLKIPAFPPVASKLLRIAANEEIGARDLVRLLRSDPALAAETIKHANSPLYSLMTEVTALEHAVSLLGVRKIRMLALAAISRTYLRSTSLVDQLRTFWRYSLACALLAERIAVPARLEPDTAYAAALLHDIGRLGLMIAHPEQYAEVLQKASAELAAGNNFDLLELERSLFGIDRFEAGEWLARTWNLPQELRQAASKYHFPERDGKLDLLALVYRACRLANSLGFGILDNPGKPAYGEILRDLPEAVAACLPASAEEAAEQIEKEIAALDSRGGDAEVESAKKALGTIRARYLEEAEPDNDEGCGEIEPLPVAPPRRGRRRWILALAASLLIALLAMLKWTWHRLG